MASDSIGLFTYRFNTAHNGCVAEFHDRRPIGGANRIHIDANRAKFIELSSVGPNIVIDVIAIVFDWMNCPVEMEIKLRLGAAYRHSIERHSLAFRCNRRLMFFCELPIHSLVLFGHFVIKLLNW